MDRVFELRDRNGYLEASTGDWRTFFRHILCICRTLQDWVL